MTAHKLNKFENALAAIASLFAIAGGLALVVLVAITGVSVFYRYVLRAPIFGIEDLSTMSLTVIVAASVAWTAIHKGHVSVNIITIFAGRAFTRFTDAIGRLLAFAMMAFASYALFVKGSCGMPCGAMTSNLGIIHTPFYYVLGLAMGFFAALILTHLIIGLLHWSGDDPNEVAD
ncbi:TRAP transporter small permease [Shimia abyssi]|uniref:TRAP transporter small permease protein n=1 Tax=Shimia abyssi TaxID=1662395 RepID=A0A2P8FE99_9RHOB|nr:TRAP transporter small permease [Shimia abyssi]PSL20045.1 TRAP-type C4-dicarboxylate transport system permease small subunit [Shimia abyssi]